MDSTGEYEVVPEKLAARLPRPPGKQTFRFNRICIVEWLYAAEWKTGNLLAYFLRKNWPEVDVHFQRARSKKGVLDALCLIADEADREGTYPLLQIDAHGGKEALGYYGPGETGEEELLRWVEMRDVLTRINRASRANLIVFSAACWGHGALMAATGAPLPFMAIVGPTESVDSGPLLEASKEFYRHALSKTSGTSSFEMAVEESARQMGNLNGMARDSMVAMTYDALVRGVWTKCKPHVLRSTALDMAMAAFCSADGVVDLQTLPYSSAVTRLHQDQGKAARNTWRERLLLDTWPENEARFGFDVEAMVRIILDERFSEAVA